MKTTPTRHSLPTISPLVAVFVLIMAAMPTMPSYAQFINGGFESSTFEGWNKSGGTWEEIDGVVTFNWTGDPGKSAIVFQGYDPVLLGWGIYKNMVFGGNYAARVNNSDPSYHFSTISQTVNNWTAKDIYFDWLLVVEEPDHDHRAEPFFRITLTNVTKGGISFDKSYASDDIPAEIMHEVSSWKFTDWQQEHIDTSGVIGDTLRLEVMAADCAYGGHGGYLYVDRFSTNSRCVRPPPGLRAWWPFDETAGTTADDISYVNNQGTYYGNPTPVVGMVSNALCFDGVNDYVVVTSHSEINFTGDCTSGAESFTIDTWIRANSGGPTTQTLLDKQVNGPDYQGYNLYLQEGKLGFRIATGAGGYQNYTSPTMPDLRDGQWHFIAVTVARCGTSGNAGTFYLDGNKVVSTFLDSQTGDMNNTADLLIGRNADGSSPYLGCLDELEIYKRALTEWEIKGIFNAGSAGKCKTNCYCASISGYKYNDLNGNGVWDSGEEGKLANWTMRLSDGQTAVTDNEGYYHFTDLLDGTYTVTEMEAPAWKQTAPVGGSYTVTLLPAQSANDLAFGNQHLTNGYVITNASISGFKFNDLNGDGVWDAGEPVVTNWTILLSSGTNFWGCTTTDTNGQYHFIVPRGNYTVAESNQLGWCQTAPTGLTYTVTLTNGQMINGLDFGNTTNCATLSGGKFNDLNGDGVWQDNEPWLPNWDITLFLKTPTGSIPLKTVQTDANGEFQFTVPAGTYTLKEAESNGWCHTFPLTGELTVRVDSGQQIANLDFANTNCLAGITGFKFADTNCNGIFDAGEPKLAGWTINLLDGTSIVDSTVTDANGDYQFTVQPGTYTVTEVAKPGWVQTAPVGGSYTVTLLSAQNTNGLNFGNSTNCATISGFKFWDTNSDGVWQDGEPKLTNWTINLQRGSNVVDFKVTDADGHYQFDVPPGTYTIAESNRPGWCQTSPQNLTYTVTLLSAQNTNGLNFGNTTNCATISGFKFWDTNCDGVWQTNEPKLANWTINLQRGSSVVDFKVTDANGNYQFSTVSPGTYIITESNQSGWWPSGPSVGIVVKAGQVTNLNVGNCTNRPSSGTGYWFEKFRYTPPHIIIDLSSVSNANNVPLYPSKSAASAAGEVVWYTGSQTLHAPRFPIILDRDAVPIHCPGWVSDAHGFQLPVWVEANGSLPQAVTTTNGYTNWSATITPRLWSNSILFTIVNPTNPSTALSTAHLNFTYLTFAPLTLTTNGSGTVTPNLNGSNLLVGYTYKLTGKAAPGWLLSNWVSTASDGWSETVPWNSTFTYPFEMRTNMSVTAKFVTNRFSQCSTGTYWGLFRDADATFEGSGLIKFTVNAGTTKTGTQKVTGSAWVEGQSVGFVLYPNLAGIAYTNTGIMTNKVTHHTYKMTMELDLDGGYYAHGWLTNLGTLKVSEYQAYRSPYGKPPKIGQAPMAGKYTMRMPGGSEGDGYATITLGTNGIAVAGRFGDTAKIGGMQTTMNVFTNGLWPFYMPMYRDTSTTPPTYHGSAFGWLGFTNADKTVGGVLTWIKKANMTMTTYTNGFTNNIGVIGNVWTNDGTAACFVNLTNGQAGQVEALGGYLPVIGLTVDQPWTNMLTPSTLLNKPVFGKNKVATTRLAGYTNNPTGMTLTLTPKTGKINGMFYDDWVGKHTTFTYEGAILANQDTAYGLQWVSKGIGFPATNTGPVTVGAR